MVASELSQAARAEQPQSQLTAELKDDAPQTVPLVNRVGQSKSPYVRSHAEGKVAWQLLDDETIDRAKKENKLIFLHIGFKACHYSRLTSTECFTHSECAKILNESFIPVIIDREERPELDTIYMNYVQAVSGNGGWPLNLFLTPELEPVFGGTYYPAPEPNNGSSGDDERLDFLAILKKLQKVWKEQEARCRQEAKEVVVKLHDFAAEGTLGATSTVEPGVAGSQSATLARSETGLEHPGTGRTAAVVSSELDLEHLEEAYTHIAGTFDPVYGGFGVAPKFPTPPKLSFLLRLPRYLAPVQDVVGETECAHAAEMALFTLRKIRDSGLRDHVGGHGFARYSVTADWSVPRFEKLVVHNALLLGLYLDAWLIATGGEKNGEFYDVVVELVDYLTSAPISLPDGGFVSSEAADSYRRGDRHLREGAYSLWTRREFDSVIGDDHEAALAASYWNVLEDGNIEPDQDPNDEFVNENILRVVKDKAEIGRQAGITIDDVERVLASAKQKLKAHREKERTRPEADTKIVAGRNGLVIGALARTGSALAPFDADRSNACFEAASKAAAFIRANLWDENEKILYRIYSEGRGDTKGLADDYAHLIEGLIDLYEATGEEKWAEFADELQKVQIDIFYDSTSVPATTPTSPTARSSCGAFYTTPENAPHTILRLKDGMDTALPSTNAVSVSNLFRLGIMLSDEAYTALARESINAFEAEILQYPWLFPGLLSGVVTARLGGATWVVIRKDGVNDDEIATKLLRKIHSEARGGLRNIIVLKSENDALAKRSPALKELVTTQKPGAYRLEDGIYRPVNRADVA
ncbi:Spermatogenesis-associated protein 20 [Colletotrichum gloeosporioides]|uniref:Spermatogenesis-associated protein 20 n=1 Tax=Colletotrichum gloeosporioides TaxID=474922 RepID=A0A8H4CP10_COLGL|nr:Spermatogenesis-associated protein 20 [Colletotrichum gloeosporioides]KAF3807399.1 Spermatogenesis-associated protein 20 [Colletotrichum gloeosporioides]